MVNNMNYVEKKTRTQILLTFANDKGPKVMVYHTGPTEEKPEVPAAKLHIPIQLEKVEKKTMQAEEDNKEAEKVEKDEDMVEKDEKVKPMEEKKLSGILKKDSSRKFSLMEGRDCVTEKQP